MNEKDEFELKDRADDPMNYSASISSSWQFTGANLTNESMGFISTGNPSSIVRNGELGVPSCPSTSMANPFSANLWDHPTNSRNSGFCNFNVENSIGASNRTVNDKGGRDAVRSSIDRPLDMDWNQQNPLMKEVFSANVPGMLPASLSQLPTDSDFIERAARFSCFNNGNFGEMANHFGIPESMIGAVTMLGRQEVIARNEASKDVSLCMELEPEEKSTLKNERESERPQDKPNQGGSAESGNESDEAGFSGGDGGGQDEPCTLEGAVGEPSTGGLSFKKRKRGGKNTELGQSKEAPRQIGEIVKNGALNQRKGDQNPNLTTNKPAGKQGKQDSQASDGPKQEYIHVRARRGQATNSHSLAERVRREKISERMRLLQDLVPGCSKVTGKAVMLDEIINYVQSLQRQVEFLSMKLATVNPRLDFNIEGLLAKDIIQSRTGPSSFGFSPELSMPYLSQHHSHHGFIPPSLPNMGNPSDLLRRTINSQLTSLVGGFKEPIQLPNVWEDELHNVVQMNVDTTAPSDGQDVNGSIPQQCNMKAEL